MSTSPRQMNKPRHRSPRKQRRRETEIQLKRNRATGREQLELQERYRKRPIFPQPEDEERYRP